ncbi:MAG: aspartate-semialdehyde dehydrogenase [Terracidiphilus sp.]|nr:aspartate-semialdehyde dehydrogenase [Terracidiphilus sp.]
MDIQNKYPIGILGATGMVGQRYIQLLERHPWFEVAWLAASDRSSGKTYGEAAKWRLDTPCPERIARMTVSPAEPEGAPKIIFASIDAAIALELEPKFAAAGCAVVSNSSAFRMAANVPLVLPEVNAEHLSLIEEQSWRKESGGFIVTNSNCTAMGPVLALKPLVDRFGVEQIFATSMQAVSGAGYPGVPSMDILDNVIPYIGSEEEKMEAETLKLLGTLEGSVVTPLRARMSASCNRVAVVDGHTVSVSIKLATPATREEILACWAGFRPLALRHLPSAPDQPVEWAPEADRPQPRLDRNRGNGMAVTVGRLRPCNVLDWKFTVLSHNTIRGAAGATILNAELLRSLGKLDAAAPPDRSGALQRKRTVEVVDDIVAGVFGGGVRGMGVT